MQWFSVTMCYYGLSFASTSLSSGGPYLNYMLRWQSSENPTISKIKPDMEANNWSCFPQQCDDRDPWLPLLHLCHGLLGKETDPQLLSGCYQHSNKKVAIFSFLATDYIWRCLHLLWPLARTDWSRPQKSAGELLLVFKTHCSRELNEKIPQTSGIPLPLGQVWGFRLLLHRLPLHCRALSYNCEVVVS